VTDSADALPATDQAWSPRRGLAWLGRWTRARLRFVLALMALAAYTLGVVFVLVMLLVGFAMARSLDVVQDSLWTVLDTVLRALAPTDFVIFPVKMLAIGLLIGSTACLTALSADVGDEIGRLISRGFIRGMLAIMLTSGLLSLAI
jgi:phospholipid/cholesterol/gamma-HCH transport system permease protein